MCLGSGPPNHLRLLRFLAYILFAPFLRDTVVRKTNFVVEHHFRCLTVSFRGLGLRISAPEPSFCIGLGSFLAGTYVSLVRRS